MRVGFEFYYKLVSFRLCVVKKSIKINGITTSRIVLVNSEKEYKPVRIPCVIRSLDEIFKSEVILNGPNKPQNRRPC